jgi:hypothetical protein
VRARTGGVPESDTGGGAGLSRVRLEHDEAEGMTGRPQRPVTASAAQAGGTGWRWWVGWRWPLGRKVGRSASDGGLRRGCCVSWAGWLGRCAELLLLG